MASAASPPPEDVRRQRAEEERRQLVDDARRRAADKQRLLQRRPPTTRVGPSRNSPQPQSPKLLATSLNDETHSSSPQQPPSSFSQLEESVTSATTATTDLIQEEEPPSEKEPLLEVVQVASECTDAELLLSPLSDVATSPPAAETREDESPLALTLQPAAEELERSPTTRVEDHHADYASAPPGLTDQDDLDALPLPLPPPPPHDPSPGLTDQDDLDALPPPLPPPPPHDPSPQELRCEVADAPPDATTESGGCPLEDASVGGDDKPLLGEEEVGSEQALEQECAEDGSEQLLQEQQHRNTLIDEVSASALPPPPLPLAPTSSSLSPSPLDVSTVEIEVDNIAISKPSPSSSSASSPLAARSRPASALSPSSTSPLLSSSSTVSREWSASSVSPLSPVSRRAALGGFRSISTGCLPTRDLAGSTPTSREAGHVTTAITSSLSLPNIVPPLGSSLASQSVSAALRSHGSHIELPERKRRWAREAETANSLGQVAARYRTLASESEKRRADQSEDQLNSPRKSVLGSLFSARRPLHSVSMRYMNDTPIEAAFSVSVAPPVPQGTELARKSISRMLALLRAHRTKPVQGKELETWELYLEHYLIAGQQALTSNEDAERKGHDEEQQRQKDQRFVQHWNDQAFKLAPSATLTEIGQHFEQIYNSPTKRLNLLGNGLRSDAAWQSFCSTAPSMDTLQFSCHTLVLSLNELTQTPIEICRLVHLRHLYISFNKLSSLPSEIGFLKHLTVLEARGNEITSLPWSFYELTSLRKLDLSQNRISRLHSSLGNLSRLESLNLAYNQLLALPYEIGALYHLRELNLRGNQLSWLPESMASLSHLTRLDLEQNKSSSHMSLCLHLLSTTGQPRSAAPSELGVVSPSPPPQALTKYFGDLLASSWSPAHTNVYVLGNDGAGKTSLIHCLTTDSTKRSLFKNRKIKRGVRVETSTANTRAEFCPLLDSTATPDIQLQYWEFSGQAKAAHEVFWSNSKNTVFVVVWDVRHSDAESNLESWFKAIYSVCSGSSAPAIIVVGTHLDGAKIDNYSNLIFDKYSLLYPTIRFATAISCVREDNAVAELREKVKQIATQEIRMQEQVPLSFVLLHKLIAQQNAEWHEFEQAGAYVGAGSQQQEGEARLGRTQLPVISASQFWALLEFCRIVSPNDSSRERQRTLHKVVSFLHSMSSAFWLPLLANSNNGSNKGLHHAHDTFGQRPSVVQQPTGSLERRDSLFEADNQATLDELVDSGDHELSYDGSNAYDGDDDKLRRGERDGPWCLVADVKWLLDVLGRTLEAQTENLIDGGVLHHRHLASLWGNTTAASKRCVPDYLHVRLHALLEAMELLWTPSRLATPTEREKDPNFLAKGLSFVPALFPDGVPYSWIKWATFLGRPATERFEGDMAIRRSTGSQLDHADDEEIEPHLGGMVGDIKFERWWIFPFLPSGLLPRFLLRFLRSVQAQSADVSSRATGAIQMTLDTFWAHGAVLVSEDSAGECTAVIISARPLSPEVNKVFRARVTHPQAARAMKAESAGPDTSMIFKVSVWEKNSPPGRFSVQASFLATLLIKTMASLMTSSRGVEFNTSFRYCLKGARSELPCPHCLMRYKLKRDESLQQQQQQHIKSSPSQERSSPSMRPHRQVPKSNSDKRVFVPHLFEWSKVVAAIDAGRGFITCDDVSRVRVDALVPELIPRETHLIISPEDWADLTRLPPGDEWFSTQVAGSQSSPTAKVLTRTYSMCNPGAPLLAAAIDDIKRIAWLSGDDAMRPHVQRIVGICVFDDPSDKIVRIGVALERPTEGVMLSKYLTLHTTATTGGDALNCLATWKDLVLIAVQLCRTMVFLSEMSPPLLLGSQLNVANILLQQSQEGLTPKFISAWNEYPDQSRTASTINDVACFGRLLLRLFMGSSLKPEMTDHIGDVHSEMAKLQPYPSWESADEVWKAKVMSLASTCFATLDGSKAPFERVYAGLVDLQKTLEPSRHIAIIKTFRKVKHASSVVSDAIQCLALVPHRPHSNSKGVNEDMIWAGCSDGSLWIFDSSSGELLYSKLAHAKRVLCITPLEEEGTVWTSSVDQTIKIWKAKEGKMIRVLGGFGEEICAMRNIQGNMWCGALSGKLYIWDLENLSCRKVHDLGTVPVWSVVEHQGKVWAAVGTVLVRFDAQTFTKSDELKGHTKPITCLVPVGDEVWSGAQDHTVRVWRGSDGVVTHTLHKHSQKVYSLLAYNDQCVWSGSWDKTIIIWDTLSKEPTQVLQDVHDDAISMLVKTKRSTPQVWSASWDKHLCLWE